MADSSLKLRILAIVKGVKDVLGLNRSIDKLGKESTETAKEAEHLNRSIGKTEGAANKTGLAVAKTAALITGLGLAIAKVVSSIKDWVGAANVQERAEKKLETSLRNLTGASDEQIQALKDQASALQELTGYGDEQTISAQAMLATFQLNAAQIQELTPRILDMAEATRKAGSDQVDLEQISIAVGKTFTDGIGALKRYGVALSDAQEEAFKNADQMGKVRILADVLDGNFKGLAEAIGKTYEGAVRKAADAQGDLQEVLGQQITSNQDVIEATNTFKQAYNEMAAGVKAASGEIGEAVSFMARLVKGILGSVQVAWNGLQIAVKSTVLVINEGINLINKAMAKITFGDVSKEWQKAADELAAANDDLRMSIGEDVADIRRGLGKVSDAYDGVSESAKETAPNIDETATAMDHLDVAASKAASSMGDLNDKLTAQDAIDVATWINYIEAADNATEALQRTNNAMGALGENTAAAAQFNDAYQRSLQRLGSVADEITAKNARLAATYITQIQNAKTLEDANRALAKAAREVGDNTQVMALASETHVQKQKELEAAAKSASKGILQVTDSTEDNYMAMLHLQTQYDKGEISVEEFSDGVSALKEKNDELRDAQHEVNNETKDAADSQRDAADATDEHNQAITSAISLTHVVRNRYYEMSEAVGKYFDNSMRAVRSIEDWWDAISDRRYEQVKAQYEELVRQNDALIDRLKSGVVSSDDLRRAQTALASESINAAHGIIGLGEQELAPLRAALADAQSRIEALRDSAESTLVSLQNELDRLNGNMAAIEQRNYEQKRLELQQKLAEAQAAGDQAAIAALQKSLQILKQIHQVKMANLDADQKAAAAAASGGVHGDTQTSSRPQTRGSISGTFAGQRASQSKHVIELRDSRGNRTEIGVTDEEQAYRFLDALEKAGLASI